MEPRGPARIAANKASKRWSRTVSVELGNPVIMDDDAGRVAHRRKASVIRPDETWLTRWSTCSDRSKDRPPPGRWSRSSRSPDHLLLVGGATLEERLATPGAAAPQLLKKCRESGSLPPQSRWALDGRYCEVSATPATRRSSTPRCCIEQCAVVRRPCGYGPVVDHCRVPPAEAAIQRDPVRTPLGTPDRQAAATPTANTRVGQATRL